MNGTGQRAARSALDSARAAVDQLGHSRNPEDTAATLIEAWESVELGLKAMAGTHALSGQHLLRELRQRDLLTLSEAHALIDFGALAERARAHNYTPSPRDHDAARAAVEELARVVERGGPAASRAAAPSSAPAASNAPPPLEIAHPPRANLLGRILVIVAVVAVLGGAGYAAFVWRREPGDLRKGRAAYAAGDRLTARTAFTAVAAQHPTLAEPHVYLGRLAREAGDLPTANEALRRAVALEPSNFLAHRELAAFLLASRRPDLARAFYERAIRLNPGDRTSLGYMGCTMAQLGRPDVAQRFVSRAGPGPWDGCAQLVPPQVMPPTPPPQ
ncbi:MAG: tetratricopeptide repeat protein [Gemmatimonadaceae bacterium]